MSFFVEIVREIIHAVPPEEENAMMSHQGHREGEAALLLKLIRRKFGQVPDWVPAKIGAADVELIETWSDNFVFANSVDDVFAS
ncbi:MAG: hypothetical protein HQL93_03675 [Magnetococcales bacterium]|nr:hypothetical protein [Magnetococcales bacterium]